MSAEHRRPVVAFVMLAVVAGFLVGVQQVKAGTQPGLVLAAAVGSGARVQGSVPPVTQMLTGRQFEQIAAFGPAFTWLHDAVGHAETVTEPLPMVIGTSAAHESRVVAQAVQRQPTTAPPAQPKEPGRDAVPSRTPSGTGHAAAAPHTADATPSNIATVAAGTTTGSSKESKAGGARTAKADKPAAKPDKPAAKPDKAAAKADRPVAKADKPAAKADRPVAKADKPAAKPARPVAKADKAAAKADKAAAKADKRGSRHAGARRR